jgi:hypothetical protein
MIRLVYCVSRRADISLEEFRRFWCDERFSALYEGYDRVYKSTSIKKTLVLKVPMNAAIVGREGTRKPYDGVIEILWDSAKELVAVHDTPEARELRRQIGEFEQQFVDKSRSTIFFTEYQG